MLSHILRIIVNTSTAKGASGTYKVNPDYKDFDTRSAYAGKELGPVETVIEEVRVTLFKI